MRVPWTARRHRRPCGAHRRAWSETRDIPPLFITYSRMRCARVRVVRIPFGVPMTFFNSTGGQSIIVPEAVGDLVVQPVQEASVATRVTEVVSTPSPHFRIPVLTESVTAAWTPEGEEITPSVPTVSEVIVTPRKIAALIPISNELANDSSPAAASLVGRNIADELARELDKAFFGVTTANSPTGLQSVANITAIPAATIVNSDPFVDAEFAAAAVGASINSWVCNAKTAAKLSKIKEATGSNRNLLQPDATGATRRAINGVPLFVVPDNAVEDDVVWGIDKTRVFTVIRQDVSLVVDRSVYFTKDAVAVRATMRVGFAYPHPASIVRIGAGGS